MLSEVTPELQQLNREAHPRLPFGALWYTGTSAINSAVFPEKNHAIDNVDSALAASCLDKQARCFEKLSVANLLQVPRAEPYHARGRGGTAKLFTVFSTV